MDSAPYFDFGQYDLNFYENIGLVPGPSRFEESKTSNQPLTLKLMRQILDLFDDKSITNIIAGILASFKVKHGDYKNDEMMFKFLSEYCSQYHPVYLNNDKTILLVRDGNDVQFKINIDDSSFYSANLDIIKIFQRIHANANLQLREKHYPIEYAGDLSSLPSDALGFERDKILNEIQALQKKYDQITSLLQPKDSSDPKKQEIALVFDMFEKYSYLVWEDNLINVEHIPANDPNIEWLKAQFSLDHPEWTDADTMRTKLNSKKDRDYFKFLNDVVVKFAHWRFGFNTRQKECPITRGRFHELKEILNEVHLEENIYPEQVKSALLELCFKKFITQ